MKIIGLDLSLASTGIATVKPDSATVTRIKSTGRKGASLYDRHVRLHKLRYQIGPACAQADLVVIEGPSFGQSRQGGEHDRAGLWWLMVDRILSDLSVPVVEITPAQVKQYATGKGNAAKDAVLAAVIRRYPAVEVTGNDEADALILAAMAADQCGRPLVPMPAAHRKALDKVAWPLEVVMPRAS